MLEEIETLKSQKEKRQFLFQQNLDKEKSLLQAKVDEIEALYKQQQAHRNKELVEHEKEKSKFNLEKDHLLHIKNELTE